MRDIMDYKENKTLMNLLDRGCCCIIEDCGCDIDKDINYDINLRKVHSYMTSVWRLLNGLPVVSDVSCRPDAIPMSIYTPEYYFRNSILWKHRNTLMPTTSNIFKGRFLSAISSRLITILDEAVAVYIKRQYDYIDGLIKSEVLSQVVECYAAFVKNMILDKNYILESDKIFELFAAVSDGDIPRRYKFINSALDELNKLRSITKNGLIGIDFAVEDSIIISNMCLLAYITTLETPPTENILKNDYGLIIKPDVKFSDDDKIRSIVEALGKRILTTKSMVYPYSKFSKKHVVSEIYDVFYKSKPEILYRFKDINYNIYLREGCRALSYLGFLSHSEVVQKILNKIIY